MNAVAMTFVFIMVGFMVVVVFTPMVQSAMETNPSSAVGVIILVLMTAFVAMCGVGIIYCANTSLNELSSISDAFPVSESHFDQIEPSNQICNCSQSIQSVENTGGQHSDHHHHRGCCP